MMPMANAPLFGSVRRRAPGPSSLGGDHADRVLPQRKHADYLFHLYWQHIHPLEPLLDKESFSTSYEALFAGTALDMEENVLLATMNTVFAMATELQEDLEPERRDEASNTYFGRALALLPPESVLWDPGSIQVVECLLLMSRYLQGTSNSHQTWMTVCSAVCIAQNLGLHTSERPCGSQSTYMTRHKRRVWQCCVFIHR